MNHNKPSTASAPEHNGWGAPVVETSSDDWSHTPTPEATIETAQRKGLVKRFGEKVAPKFIEGRDIRKGYEKLQQIKDAKFRPLDQKPAFKVGSEENMYVRMQEQDDWEDAHAMNAAHDAGNAVAQAEQDLVEAQGRLAETRRNPVQSSTLEELDGGAVRLAERDLAAAKSTAEAAGQRASFTDNVRRGIRGYTEERVGLGSAPSERSDDEW